MSQGRPRPPARIALEDLERRNEHRPGTVRHAERELELVLEDLAGAIRADLLELAARVARRLRGR